MIPYDRALQLWGLLQLRRLYPEVEFVPATVTVEMDFNEGYACCGGTDPDCYCSFAESPKSDVVVRGQAAKPWSTGPYFPMNGVFTWTESAESFDFADMVRELFEVAQAEENQ